MRAYFFGNMYLSSIQQGIQAQHTTAEMFIEYPDAPDLLDWATNHKTSILLNGGYSENLHRLVDSFAVEENDFAWGHFHESEEALDGALTCVGIILPAEIYDTAAFVRSARTREDRLIVDKFNDTGVFEEELFSDFEIWLINEITNYGLAS